MRFPRELERQVLNSLRNGAQDHITFAADEYRHGHITIYRDNLGKSLHRYLWEQVFGPLRKGLFMKRECDEPRCVNPYHFGLTRTSRPLAEKCPKGHRYTEGNTVIRKGVRHCLTCRRAANARRSTGGRRPGFCKRNHKLTEANSYRWVDRQGRTHRRCKKCTLEAARERRGAA